MKSLNLRAFAPAIAIALIFLIYFLAQFWILPAGREAETPSAAQQAPKAAALPIGPMEAQPAENWSTYHGGPGLSGYVENDVTSPPVVRWQRILEGAIHQAPVANGLGIFVATGGGGITALTRGGDLLWQVQLTRDDGSPERLEAALTCIEQTVIAPCLSGAIYALKAESGERLWRTDIGGEIMGAANVFVPQESAAAKQLYVIQRQEGILHRLDLQSGSVLGKAEPLARCDGSPAVEAGRVVYGSCDFALHVHEAENGALLKNVRLCDDCQVASGPAVIDNLAYVGSRIGYFYCVDVETGGIVWTNQDCAHEIFTTPAVSSDTVVFGAEDDTLYALERKTGKLRWRFEGDDPPASPVIAGTTVLVGIGGILHALNAQTGELVWQHEVSDGITAAAMVDDLIVLGSEDGTVLALGPSREPNAVP